MVMVWWVEGWGGVGGGGSPRPAAAGRRRDQSPLHQCLLWPFFLFFYLFFYIPRDCFSRSSDGGSDGKVARVAGRGDWRNNKAIELPARCKMPRYPFQKRQVAHPPPPPTPPPPPPSLPQGGGRGGGGKVVESQNGGGHFERLLL